MRSSVSDIVHECGNDYCGKAELLLCCYRTNWSLIAPHLISPCFQIFKRLYVERGKGLIDCSLCLLITQLEIYCGLLLTMLPLPVAKQHGPHYSGIE